MRVLAKFALEMLAPPASQAFVECLFPLCGIMTAGRRNRMSSSLEMRVWLKMNHDVLNHLNNLNVSRLVNYPMNRDVA